MATPKSLLDERTRVSAAMAKARAEARDITIPKCKNPARRKKCESDPVEFARTYFSKQPDKKKFPGKHGMISAELSPIHIELIQHLKERILYGGSEAFVAPRGFGKDTIAKIMAMWATFYGHTRFVVYACFEATKSEEAINSIKEQIEVNDLLLADFPEICVPARALNRASQRAKAQTCDGEFTRIEWSGTIVLPSVKGRPCSGNIIAPGSMGASIRGLNVNGERPSFVIISDPQTKETAKSEEQCEQITSKINADFGGLGSHVEPLACLCLMTIIRVGDVADNLTNPEMNPQWNGKRLKAMPSMPKNMELWEEYFELMNSEARKKGDKDGTYRIANEFYIDNRAAMDEGAEVAWEDGYFKRLCVDGTMLETSAVQHMMNWLWAHGEEAFLAECQGEPVDKDQQTGINVEMVCSRLSLTPHRVAPRGYELLVRAVDVRAGELHEVVCGVHKNGSRSVIHYGIHPYAKPQGNLSDKKSAVRPALERAVLNALIELRDITDATNPYMDCDGHPLEIALTLVDSGWLPDPIYIFVKKSGTRYRATKGYSNRPGSRRFTMPKRTRTEIPGNRWYISWLAEKSMWIYILDSDHWKIMSQDGFAVDPGSDGIKQAGAIDIWGHDPRDKTLIKFAKHICSERWNMQKGKFEQLSEWNHWLDCLAGCGAAADMVGVAPLKKELPKVETKNVSLEEYFGRKKKERRELFAT